MTRRFVHLIPFQGLQGFISCRFPMGFQYLVTLKGSKVMAALKSNRTSASSDKFVVEFSVCRKHWKFKTQFHGSELPTRILQKPCYQNHSTSLSMLCSPSVTISTKSTNQLVDTVNCLILVTGF